jgi:integrase
LESPKGTKGTKGTEIEILTVEEARALLQTAQDHFPRAVASYALQLFAGIRVEEITRLEENNVTVEGIELIAAVTKKGRRRHITPCPTLAAWLTAFPFTPCPNWKRIDVACRRMAGWQLESATLMEMERRGTVETIPKITRGEWKQKCLRHSHASYSVAAGVPLESLLFEFGHSGTPAMLRQHYVGVASKKQAIEFFEILPPGAVKPARLEVVKSNKRLA